jgi:hypothetical protein
MSRSGFGSGFRSGSRSAAHRVALVSLALAGCEAATPSAPDRAAGDRTPLTRPCDEVDGTRCLLPWPSNAFAIGDASTATGLRLSVDTSVFNRMDDGTILSRADGFSRVSTLVAGFPVPVDPSSAASAIHLFLAQRDHAGAGREESLRTEVVVDSRTGESLVIAHPLAPLEPNADYVVVIDDSLRADDGSALEPSRGTEIALALAEPLTGDDANLAGYHAPTRAFVAERGFALDRVLRAWDFTTRSADDPRRRLRAMREAAVAAVDGGAVTIAVDSVEHHDDGAVASIVEGRLVGLPSFVAEDGLAIELDGSPRQVGTREAPFRVVVPRGTGDYPMLMYGHGTGGSVHESTFDEPIAGAGAAKVAFEFYGWTDETVVGSFVGLQTMAIGSSVASAGLVQSIADGSAIRRAMSTLLGDVLAADELGGMPNPNAGRRPDDSTPIWVGGSLGGTMGLVFAASDPEVRHAVLNVPGAGWATWTRDALQFDYISGFIGLSNGGDLSVPILVAIAQTMFDEADGASWVDVLAGDPLIALEQESIGDPVLPNPGTEMVARVTGAIQVGAVLVPIEGVDTGATVRGASALTQFRVSDTDAIEIHGFAARDTPAANAAQAQIVAFVRSVWAGVPVIAVPEGCAGGSCDFR